MQTFLPYDDFIACARVLDNKRLGKQRVEAWQILNALRGKSTGWSNHPAVKMWDGNEEALAYYGAVICDEWINRGFRDSMQDRFLFMFGDDYDLETIAMPDWMGREDFHASHRSNLLRKNREHYSKFGWAEPDNLEYVWPTKEYRQEATI